MRLEIQHLRTLAALRDTESLRHAAERVSLTPSAVSHQLKDLEVLVGRRLFIRKTHPVRFTPAGTRLLALADTVLPEVRRALVDVDSLSEGIVEHLFVNVEHHGPTRWLLAALEGYHQAWPNVAVDVPMASTLDPLPALARGDLDVVFTNGPDQRSRIGVRTPVRRRDADRSGARSSARRAGVVLAGGPRDRDVDLIPRSAFAAACVHRFPRTIGRRARSPATHRAAVAHGSSRRPGPGRLLYAPLDARRTCGRCAGRVAALGGNRHVVQSLHRGEA